MLQKVVINDALGHLKGENKNGIVYNTYIFKSVFAELHHEVEKDQGREPQAPHDHLLHCLHVQHAKNENELVEDKVPELIFEVLRKKKHTQIKLYAFFK